MKMLVETAGRYQLMDNDTRTLIRHEGYTVVSRTTFVDKWVMLGQIKFVAEVADAATDAEWREYVKASDGDLQLALESFKANFPVGGAVVPESPEASETPPRKRKG
jgi:hypothetical protein